MVPSWQKVYQNTLITTRTDAWRCQMNHPYMMPVTVISNSYLEFAFIKKTNSMGIIVPLLEKYNGTKHHGTIEMNTIIFRKYFFPLALSLEVA